jgi:hypothetical protein
MDQQSGHSDESFVSRLGSAGVGLLILAVAWYFMRLDWVLTAAIATVIVVGSILPPMIGAFAGAAGWFGLAALVYFYYGAKQLAMMLTVIGAIFLIMAIGQVVRHRGAAQRQGD